MDNSNCTKDKGNSNNLDLFGDDGSTPIQPTIEQSELDKNYSLKSKGIEEAISHEYVKTLMIPENLSIDLPNYVLDFRQAKTLRKHQIHILTTLIREDGDTNIYVCLSNGMEKLGMGVGSLLDTILLPGIQSVFGESCKLYKDVKPNSPITELKQQDPKSIRLEL